MTYINDLNVLRQIELFEKAGDILDKEIELVEIEHNSRINFINECSLMETENLVSISKKYEIESKIYMEASESIWQKFKKWVSGIVKAIFGSKDKVPTEAKTSKETITLDFDPKERVSFIKQIQKAVKENKKKITIGSMVLAGAGLVATAKSLLTKKKPTTITEQEASECINEAETIAKDVESDVNSTNENDQNTNEKVPILKLILSTLSSITATITSKLNTKKSKPTDDKDSKENTKENSGENEEPFDSEKIKITKTQLMSVRNALAKEAGIKNLQSKKIVTIKDIDDALDIIDKAILSIKQKGSNKNRQSLTEKGNKFLIIGRKLKKYMTDNNINEFVIDDEFTDDLYFESAENDDFEILELLKESDTTEFDKLKLLIALT